MIPFIFPVLKAHDSVFFIGIPCPHRTVELFFQSSSYRFRHCLRNRNNCFHYTSAAVSSCFSDIFTQFSKGRRISYQTFDFFLLDHMKHFFQSFFIHSGTVHHDQIFLQKLKFAFAYIIYPYPDKCFLHSNIISGCRSEKNPARCIVTDLVTILDHSEWSSCRSTGTHYPVIWCIFICGRYKTVILLSEGIFIYHRKILKRTGFRIIFIKISSLNCMRDQILDSLLCLLNRAAFFPGITNLVIIFSGLSTFHFVQHPEPHPAKSFI